MTNEDKARELYPLEYMESLNYDPDEDINLDRQHAFLDGCEWKEHEFKAYLEKVLKNLSIGSIPKDIPMSLIDREQGKRDIVKYIINDLFGR